MAGFGSDDGCFIFSLGPKLIVTGRLDDPKRSSWSQARSAKSLIYGELLVGVRGRKRRVPANAESHNSHNP